MNNALRSEFDEAREIETSRQFRGPGECNGCENECQGVALESSRQALPILRTLRSNPQAILEDSTFTIAIINVTFYYSATPVSVYASRARRAVCIICRILALYSEYAAETIPEGLKSNIFLGGIPPDLPCESERIKLYVLLNPPCELLPTPLCG